MQYIPVGLYFVAVCLIEYRGFWRRKKEYGELMQFAEFLSNLNYEFYLCKNVTEAIYRAAEGVSGELRKRLEEICFYLEGDETGVTVAEYRYPKHLKYLKLFFLQCQNAVWYGSGRVGEESMFIRNMTELRRDVQNECYKRSQAGFLFAGLGLVAALPVVCLPLVKKWGCSTMPELLQFYHGTAGQLTAAALCLITIGCYGLLAILKRVDGTVYQRPLMLKRMFEGTFFVEAAKRLEGSTVEAWARRQLYGAGIYRNGTEYLLACGIAGSTLSLGAGWFLRKEAMGTAAVGMVFALLCGVILMMAFYRYLAYVRTLGMSGEVLGLQSVILLLYQVPNMTVMKLMTTLEEYAELFQRSLLHCSDCYASEDDAALADLRMAETYPAFRQLAGRLAVSERIGLERAFSDIAADRQFFREQERLDTEQELKKRAANGQVLAFVPMMFLLFAYLIIPFLAASLSQMGEVFEEMEQFRIF